MWEGIPFQQPFFTTTSGSADNTSVTVIGTAAADVDTGEIVCIEL
jgi:hypothetical protein